jgi:hypothetical protein
MRKVVAEAQRSRWLRLMRARRAGSTKSPCGDQGVSLMFGSTDIDSQVIAEWRPFFSMTAGAAAGLAGLLFVALSLHLRGITANPAYRYRARATLSVSILIFVISGLVLLPRQTGIWLGIEELVAIALQIGMLIWGISEVRAAAMKRTSELASTRPYQIRTAVGLVLGLVAMVGAVLLLVGIEFGLYILAFFCLVVLVWMVINSWALVVGIADEERSSGSGSAPRNEPSE